MKPVEEPEPLTKPLQALDELEAPPLSLSQMFWRRFRRHRMAMVGILILGMLMAFSLVGSAFFSEAYANQTETGNRLQPPSQAHPFGTDTIGRDLLARAVFGGQISMLIGLMAMIVEALIGVTIGALAGYYGKWIDSLLMRITEAWLNIPALFLLLIMAKAFSGRVPEIKLLGRTFSGSVVVIILIIGITSWMYLARIVRAEFLSLKEQEFILAARRDRDAELAHHHRPHPAEYRGADRGRGHAQRGQCHPA